MCKSLMLYSYSNVHGLRWPSALPVPSCGADMHPSSALLPSHTRLVGHCKTANTTLCTEIKLLRSSLGWHPGCLGQPDLARQVTAGGHWCRHSVIPGRQKPISLHVSIHCICFNHVFWSFALSQNQAFECTYDK
jgi:hypothetical protein